MSASPSFGSKQDWCIFQIDLFSSPPRSLQKHSFKENHVEKYLEVMLSFFFTSTWGKYISGRVLYALSILLLYNSAFT